MDEIAEILRKLLSGKPVSLAAWMAEPLPAQRAEEWLRPVQKALKSLPVNDDAGFGARVASMIVRYWSGRDIDMDYRSLHATVPDDRARAQLELCIGQLFLASRCESAWTHLDAGFALAANILQPEEYFSVLKRHERLRSLPLYRDPRPAAGLQQLLEEAGVIARLRGGGIRSPNDTKHNDTLG